jgi:ABC-2 type transport system permease protein
MKNTLIIIKHEILTTLQKRSFWLMTFLFPAIIMGLSLGTQAVGEKAIVEAEEAASSVEQSSIGLAVGYVDQAGIINTIPDWIPPGFFASFKDEASARAAMESGEIRQFYLIPEDFIESGEYILVDVDFQPLRSSGNAEIFKDVINENLMVDQPFGLALINPTPTIEGHAIAPPIRPDEENPLTYFVPFAVLFIFFFVITTSSGFMLTSVSKEKENRTAEILLVSLKPRDLMLGKVIGLGVIALIQMSIWLGGGLIALDRGSQLLEGFQGYDLPSGFVLWAILFFILGYFLYASAMSIVGVLAPNAREAGQFTFLVLVPLMIPLWFNVAFTQSPEGTLVTFLSLFPLTAPTSMLTRLAAIPVPLWQILVSLGALALTSYLFVLLSSRLFRADTLLSNDSFSWKRLVKEVRKSFAKN